MTKVKRITSAIGTLQVVFLLIPYLIVAAKPRDALPIWPLLTFAVLTFVAGIALFLIGRYRVRLAYSLVEEQHEANLRECTGEEKQIYEKLYTAFAESYGRRRRFAVVFELINALLYVAVSLLFLMTGIGEYEDGDIRVSLIMVAAVILGAVLSVFTVSGEGKSAGKLYESASYEMDYIKRKYGYDERKIQRSAQIASAQRGIVRAVELFLKDKADLEEFRRVNKRQSLGSYFFIASFVVLIFEMNAFGEDGINWMLGTIVLALFIVLFTVGSCILIHSRHRKRDIFFRNAQKLDSGEVDSLRWKLQNECVRSSKVGGAVCLGLMALGAVVGGVLAIVGVVKGVPVIVFDPEMNAVEQYICCVITCVFVGMVAGGVGSIVAYAVYRRRINVTERALSAALHEEQRRLHEGKSY